MKKEINKRKSAKKSPGAEDSPALWCKHLSVSVLATCGFALILLLLFALLLGKTADPARWAKPAGLAAAGICALAGGFLLARLHREKALVCGLLNGIAVLCVMILLSLFFRDGASGYPAWLSCLLHVGELLLSVAGAFAGLPRKKKRKK